MKDPPTTPSDQIDLLTIKRLVMQFVIYCGIHVLFSVHIANIQLILNSAVAPSSWYVKLSIVAVLK